MFKRLAVAAVTASLLSSAAIAADRPADALPSLKARPAQQVQLAQNDATPASQASIPADSRAEPNEKKKKRRFFGLPLWGLGSLLAAGGAGAAALGSGSTSTSP
jgi:hypothetical protein